MLLLFSLATAVALAVRALAIPYTVALVVVGLGVGATGWSHPELLRRDLLFSVFLPGLVFEAAHHLDTSELRRRAALVSALAVPGVVFGMLATAWILSTTGGLPFRPALVFGAIVAATDPIAVVALFRQLDAPKPLAVIVEAESLLNDGTAIALFAVAVSFAASASVSWSDAAVSFARILAIGVTVGGVLGALTSYLARPIDDAMLEITLTVIAAYGSFALAERAGGSGVLATVTAALLASRVATPSRSERTRHAVSVFWEYLAFAFNSLVFLAMGLAVRLDALLHAWRAILLAYLAITFARAALVGLSTRLFARGSSALPWRWRAVLVWGGLRGALSMVLALSLPASFPYRDAITTITYGVVLLTLLVQGLTITPLLRRLRLGAET